MKIKNRISFDFRFTPPLDQQTSQVSNSGDKYPRPATPSKLPSKLQQMDGPSGPIRKSSKAKW
jgi:hypothetical protein